MADREVVQGATRRFPTPFLWRRNRESSRIERDGDPLGWFVVGMDVVHRPAGEHEHQAGSEGDLHRARERVPQRSLPDRLVTGWESVVQWLIACRGRGPA